MAKDAIKSLQEFASQNHVSRSEDVIYTVSKHYTAIWNEWKFNGSSVPIQDAIDVLNSLKRCYALFCNASSDAFLFCKHEVWLESILPMIDVCCFSHRYVIPPPPPFLLSSGLHRRDRSLTHQISSHFSWHAHAIQSDPLNGAKTSFKLQTTARDLIKDCIAPLFSNAIASQTQTTGICFNAHMLQILKTAIKSAEIIGWRHPDVQLLPSLRNYGLVNTLWACIITLWSSTPNQLYSNLENNPSLSTDTLVKTIVTCLERDLDLILSGKDKDAIKLLQFWISQLGKLTKSMPSAAKFAYKALFRWTNTYQNKVVSALQSMTPARKYDVHRMLDNASLRLRAARVQCQCLALISIPSAQEEITKLASIQLSDEHHESTPSITHNAFWMMVELLGQVSLMTPAVRASCIALFRKSLDLLTSANAINNAEEAQFVADAYLCYIVACSTATSSASDRDMNTWDACRVCLIQASMKAHPVVMSVLSMVWSSLGALCSLPALRDFVAALNKVLSATVSTETVYTYLNSNANMYNNNIDGSLLPFRAEHSMIVEQLCHLISSLLSSGTQAALQASQEFYSHGLHVSPHEQADACALARASAVLRIAALSLESAMAVPVVPGSIANRKNGMAEKEYRSNVSSTTSSSSVVQCVVDCIASLMTGLNSILEQYSRKICSASAGVVSEADVVPGSNMLDSKEAYHLAWTLQCASSVICFFSESTHINRSDAQLNSAYKRAAITATGHAVALLPACLPSKQQQQQHMWMCIPPILSILQSTPSMQEESHLSSHLSQCMLSPCAQETAAHLPAILSKHYKSVENPPISLFHAMFNQAKTSAVLRFSAVEAYIAYIRGCPQQNALRVLPPYCIDSITGSMDERFKRVVEKYLCERSCTVSLSPPEGAHDIDGEVQSPLVMPAYSLQHGLHAALQRQSIEAHNALFGVKVNKVASHASMNHSDNSGGMGSLRNEKENIDENGHGGEIDGRLVGAALLKEVIRDLCIERRNRVGIVHIAVKKLEIFITKQLGGGAEGMSKDEREQLKECVAVLSSFL